VPDEGSARAARGGRRWLTGILAAVALWSVVTAVREGGGHEGGLDALAEIGAALLRPELGAETLGRLAAATAHTVAYALAGMSVAIAIGFPLGALASGSWGGSGVLRVAVRFLLAGLRSIHELVWAWLLVAAVGLAPIAGVLALGIPYGGILGRVAADLFADTNERPLAALRSAGATTWGVFWWGRVPCVLPELTGYSFYRFECALRSATILSFVGLGGLGLEIDLALDDLDFRRAWTFVLGLVALVVLVEAWSAAVRRRLGP